MGKELKKDLLKMDDLSKEEILDILNLADQLKYEQKHDIEHHHLRGKSLGMIFEKASTRTRVSFEVGMYELGGNALFLTDKDLQIGRGEAIEDTARVLSRFIQGIMIRTYSQKEVERIVMEIQLYEEKGFDKFLRFCIFLSEKIEENGWVIGVGRGSSCASYLLYLLKIHLVDSIKCNLDIKELLK